MNVFGISCVSNKSNEASKGWLKRKKILDIQTISQLLVRYFESKLLTNNPYLSVKSDRKSKGSVIFQFESIHNLKFNNCFSEID